MTRPLLTRRAFGAVSALSAAGVFAPAIVRAQAEGAAALGNVTIAVGGQGVLYHLPLALADQLGYFKAEGLDVTVRDFSAGALALQAVQEGGADVCAGAFEHTIRQQVRGQSYRSLVVMGRAPQLALGVSQRSLPAYKDLADLQGRRIGVSSVGSSTHLAASVVLARAGMGPRDVAFVGVGSGMAAMNALRSGQVHALCHADPIMTLLEQKADTRIAGDMRSLKAAQEMFGGALPASCLYAPQPFLQKHAAQAQALANGIVHALKWLQTAAPADLVKAVPPGYLMGDRGLYLAAFSRVRETYSTHGMMPDDGAATALRVLSRVHPELADFKVELARTYTNDFVRKARQKFNV
ncbi:NitT/TauT family transport system substrate-binding protein [Acidovorax sp. 93]|jgi:NitT/TauT family transport system substrate-binding protein|uniref:ABC transporter substrate-binding protein n=1 Tax=Acidovorax TaxID=12916 RepID=UPI0008BB2665|nr:MULTISPECIES: ABC transporter substrate-binding protein [unclassified Acidovorax]MBT9440455.1 ABC transporter substrate-binding protein [Acidovorax sp.]OGA58237.1 MAG: ABC transporter substrate-binding protein [Burkholderiales bacterium RIFCSPHIGHO2_01_FULL_64_960]OGB11475.1 MAG: ABC transporter substrate-binding protein [Burkholderiales bacterium RIFCSPHIGHO2_02_FULL_64_19]OGB18461.1 MAG: ABC transporter substrate-binding protein [Burkholderiales bacterium RIFCSPHIGHO2_12_FULL_65_48]OGB519